MYPSNAPATNAAPAAIVTATLLPTGHYRWSLPDIERQLRELRERGPVDETDASTAEPGLDEVAVFRAKLDQRLAWAKHVLRPEPEEMQAMVDEVQRATDWESLPEGLRSFIERAEAQQPRPSGAK
jgi:hypothetical protein